MTLVNFVCLVLGCADFELRSDLKVFIGTSWITFVDCSPPKLDPCTSIAIDSLLVYIKCKTTCQCQRQCKAIGKPRTGLELGMLLTFTKTPCHRKMMVGHADATSTWYVLVSSVPILSSCYNDSSWQYNEKKMRHTATVTADSQ